MGGYTKHNKMSTDFKYIDLKIKEVIEGILVCLCMYFNMYV